MQNGTALPENILAVSYEVKHTLTRDPAIPLLGIYPREMKTYIHTKSCTQMFIVTLFIIRINCIQPKCLTTSKQVNG